MAQLDSKAIPVSPRALSEVIFCRFRRLVSIGPSLAVILVLGLLPVQVTASVPAIVPAPVPSTLLTALPMSIATDSIRIASAAHDNNHLGSSSQGMNGDPQSLRVHVSDVGEGQAVLVQKGSQGALVDTGSMVSAASLVQKITSSGVDHLEAIVLTHLHPDHATGFFRVREAYPNAMVLHNGHHAVLSSSLDSIRWVAEALQAEPNVKVFRADDVLELAGARLRALWPQEPLSDDLNQSSLVLSVESAHGERYALLMGDVGWSVEEELISNQILTDRYPLLVAGHHGSRQTAGEGFLAMVQP